MSGFQIVLGERWASDRAIVGELRAHASDGTGFDYAHVLDVVDIFIDGANVGAAASADSIVCITRDLLAALAHLLSGRAHKVTVPFYERPFELVFQRAADGAASLPGLLRGRGAGRSRRTDAGVLVTFFKGGPSPEVLVLDREVPLAEVARAVTAAARRLASQIVRLNRSLASDAFVRDLRKLADEVTSASREPRGSPADPGTAVLASPGWDRGVARGVPAFVFRSDVGWSDLLGPVLTDRSDLSALLFRGDVAVWAGGRRRLLGRCWPFLVVERMLALARHALEAHDEARQPASLRIQCDGMLLGIRPDGAGLLMSIADRADDVEPVLVPFAGPGDLVGAILDAAIDMRRAILEVSPGQRRNLRFDVFCSDLRQIHSWHRDLHSKTIVNRDPGSYRTDAGSEPERDGASPAPLLVGEPRRMRYVERWHVEAEGLDLRSTFLCGDRLVLSTADALLAVDRDSGEVVWRLGSAAPPGSSAQTVSIMAGNRGLVRASADGRVAMLDLSTGAEVWSVRVRPRVGRLVGTAVGAGRAPRMLVLPEGSGGSRRLVALDTNTGEPRWRFTARRVGGMENDSFEFRRVGRLLVVTCGDSSIYALDGDTGDVVWRYAVRGRFVLRPAFARDRLAAVSGEPGRRGAALHLLDAFTGRALWTRDLPGTPLGEPAVCQNVAAVATGDPAGVGRSGITAVETMTGTPLWRRTVHGMDRGFAWLPIDDRIVVNVAGGHTTAIHAPTGDIVWEQRLGCEFSRDVPACLEPVLRGGVLFLPAAAVHVVRPDDGEVIHRLDDGPVPDFLRVDERCGVYVGEHSGHLAAFGPVARLAVVK